MFNRKTTNSWEKSSLGSAVRLGQEAGTLLITAVQTLRSEYLAWASPHFTLIEIRQYLFYCFQD